MIEVKDLSDPSLSKLIKTKRRVALIPVGSIEQHGPHLPVSTDSDIVSEISRRFSEKTGFLLLPTINYGVSFEHHPLFNLSITKSTLQKCLIELCVSLSKNRINHIIILNGHHGNQPSLNKIPEIMSKISRGKVRVLVFSYWHFMKRKFDHAGFVETSLMLAISKKVEMKKARKGFNIDKYSEKQKIRLNKLATKSFLMVTKNGVWGDPTKATAKDGKMILSEIIRGLLKMSQTCLTDKTPKLHQ
ncbi:MAG TPA: creatininase family protein [Nitrosopumilaceae archaeon]|nr:creatininase family protein [Nitrosopumilaceae archaeon]